MTIALDSFCTGCSACANICSKNAIQMQPNKKGFLYPTISRELCINCGQCQRVCAQLRRVIPTLEGRILAALAINDQLRACSSSGGIFSVLAEKTIINGGVVFGAAFQEDMKVHHIKVDSIKDLSLLRGSKYVQSEIGYVYRQVKDFLEKKRLVLFSGTPCQVDALKRFLGKNYSNLLTVDILCHGVPSPFLLQKFIKSKEADVGKKVVKINFRDKDPGWESFSTSITYEDGTREIDNSYFYFFVNNYCLRESCSQCLYANKKRIGDITLGDYWGYQESAPEHIENDDLGISLVSINNQKGEKAFHSIRGKIDYTKRSYEDAINGNKILRRPFAPHELSDDFWNDCIRLDWDLLVEKYNVSREKKHDNISSQDRDYYAIPYKKRHMRHLIHCAKINFLHKIGIKQ